MTKFNYKQAEVELAQIVTHENGMLYVNGVAKLICQGYFLKTVVYNATNAMEDDGVDALTAANAVVTELANNVQPTSVEYMVIAPELEVEILAESPAVSGSILSKYNGVCATSGWPIIAGTHHIVAGTKHGSWIRTDKV
jgi:hypothetical protein